LDRELYEADLEAERRIANAKANPPEPAQEVEGK